MTLGHLVWRNVGRNRLRVTLTVLAVAIATFAFVLLRTVVTSWSVESDGPHSTVVTRQSVSMLTRLPIRYVDEIRRIPGVAASTPINWIGANLPNKPDAEVTVLTAEPSSFFDIYDDRFTLTPNGREKWTQERQGVIVGKKFADLMHWSVGDRLTLTSAFVRIDEPMEFVVSGIYVSKQRNFDEKTIYVRQDYVNEFLPASFKDHVSIFVTRIGPSATTAEMTGTIDAHFDDRDLATATDDEETFAKNMLSFLASIIKVIQGVSSFLMVLIAMIVANSIAMSVRERTSEYGTLRAVGFSPATIFRTIVGESLLVCMVGALVGLAASSLAVRYWLGPFLTTNVAELFVDFRVEPSTIAVCLAASAILGLLAGALPAVAALRVKTIDALRGG